MHASSGETRGSLCEVLSALTSSYDQLAQAYAGRKGLHLTDFRALLMVCSRRGAGASVSAGDLAAHLGLSSGAVTYLVERLTHAGYVQRRSDPTDRRRVLVVCTDAGRELASGFSAPVCTAASQAFEGLDEAAVDHAMALLVELQECIGMCAARLADEATVS